MVARNLPRCPKKVFFLSPKEEGIGKSSWNNKGFSPKKFFSLGRENFSGGCKTPNWKFFGKRGFKKGKSRIKRFKGCKIPLASLFLWGPHPFPYLALGKNSPI